LLAEFTEKWNSWAKDKGAITRNQAHGSPANILDLYAASGIPETEGDDLLGIKLASSAANISGKMLTSSETATWLEEHFQASLGEVKKTVDHFFLGGVNHIIYHGTTFSPQDESWPGWMFYASVHFGLTNSFWGDFPVLNEYVARCQSFLQKSQADNDILLYFPFYDLVTQPGREMLQHISSRTTQLPLPNFISAARLLQDKGYAIDYISDRQIKNLIYQDGILKSGKSVYKVIIFPECDYLSLETLEKLFDLADKGASIIVHNKFPGDVPGLYEFEKRREKMSNLTGRLKFSVVGSGNIQKASVGNGQVLIGTDLDALLAYVNVKRESMVDKGLQYIRKNYSDGKIYFINNPGDSAFEGWIPVKTDVVSAALFNPMHKTMGKAGLRKAENYVEVYLQLQPGESLILNTFSTTINSPYYPYYQIAADKQPVTGTWDITFVKGGPSLPGMIKTDSLVSWTNLGDENTRAFSGTAEYTIDLNLTVRENDLLLDLGQVCESAVVILNDKKVASLISAPYSCIISQKMLRESNQLKIVVSNLMANRIANLDKQTSSWKKFYNVNFPAGLAENRAAEGLFTAKNWQPEESGLIGPVTITPVKKPKFD